MAEAAIVPSTLIPVEEEELLDDPLEVVEEQLRRDIIEHARKDLEMLLNALDANTAPRVLRMAETIAEHHREMLATLKLSEDGIPRKRKRGPGSYVDPLTLYESGAGMMGNETFGAQAITQIGATLGAAFRDQHEGKNINNLVSAIAKAKDAHLDDVVSKLEAKLNGMLGESEPVTESEETSTEEDPVEEAQVEE
jgi:hypothetical protein